MNKRLQELAEQAGIEFDDSFSLEPETIYYLKLSDFEKFAELIVRECAKLADNLEDCVVIYSTGTGKEVPKSKIIKEHFGVE
jgi:hypothetical protein